MINIDRIFSFENFKFKPKHLYSYLENFIQTDENYNKYKDYKSVEYLNNKLKIMTPKKIFIQISSDRGIESLYFNIFNNKKYYCLVKNNDVIPSKSFENLISYAISSYIVENNINSCEYYCGSYNINNGTNCNEYVNNCYDGKRIIIKKKLK